MRNPIYTICDNVRSLYNVGAIFRTSDAANIEKLYLCGITGYPKENDPAWIPKKRIEKTALGAEKTVPWEYYPDTITLVKKLKQQGIKIYALENTTSATNYSQTTYQFPCALIVGHEVKGIDSEVLKLVDQVIKIPMYGTKTSLNVEAAYAISVFEILKQIK